MIPISLLALLCCRTAPFTDGYGDIDPPSANDAMAPNLSSDGSKVSLSWVEPVPRAEPAEVRNQQHRVRLAFLRDGKWTTPSTIVQSASMFVNWADVPSVLRASDDALIAHWLQKSGPGTYAYDVILARSEDNGATWRELGSPHDDGTETEHGFVSLLRDGAGARAFWLDGREMSEDEGHGSGDMALRTAIVHPAVGESLVLDDRVCECCNTSAAMTSNGPIIAYRNRSDDEVRDIFIVRRVGDQWTEPKAVHSDGWTIAGCPVNGPAVDGRTTDVVVAWFTAAGRASVLAAFSSDGGEHFGPPVALDVDSPLGRVDVVLLESGEAIVSWISTKKGSGAITLRRISRDGGVGPPVEVAATGLSRAAGVPRITRIGTDLLVVWTEDTEITRIRAMTIPIASVPASNQP